MRLVQSDRCETTIPRSVIEYLADGLVAGHPILLIATQAHRADFIAELRSRDVDLAAACEAGCVTLLDAGTVLSWVMSETGPKAERLDGVLSVAMDRVRSPRPDAPLRAYSELVDVLCKDGDTDGAADLEAMWNELTDARHISVLCVYEFDDLNEQSEADHLGEVVRDRPVMLSTDCLTGLTSDGSGT
jgi:hypothetical protein